MRDDTCDSPALVVKVPELADSYASALHKDDDRPSVKKEKRRKLGIAKLEYCLEQYGCRKNMTGTEVAETMIPD